MRDDFFQALASPYRREIIRLLKWRTLSAGEIAGHFDIAQPSVSRHLEVQEMIMEVMELLGRGEEEHYDAET